MKRLALSLFLAAALVGTASAQSAIDQFHGQITDNAPIDVLVSVIPVVSVTGQQALDFGNITTGTAPVTVAASPSATNGQAGLFGVSAASGFTMSITGTITQFASGEPQFSSPTLAAFDSNGNTVTITSNEVVMPGSFPGTSDLDVYVGGTIDVTGVSVGGYNTTYTLEVAYLSI